MKKIAVALFSAVAFSSSFANVDKGLAYKSSGLSADDVAAQNYFVNHFFAFDNYGIGKSGNDITAMILRPKDSDPLTLTLERYLNNKPEDAGVNAQDLAIFRSGKLKGTGMLITDFEEAGSHKLTKFISRPLERSDVLLSLPEMTLGADRILLLVMSL